MVGADLLGVRERERLCMYVVKKIGASHKLWQTRFRCGLGILTYPLDLNYSYFFSEDALHALTQVMYNLR